MNILFISDWHGHDYELPDKKIDLLVVLGDMDWRQIEKLDKFYDCPKLGILGNHDRWDNYKRTNFIPMHKQVTTIHGITIAGFDGSPQYNFKDTPQYEEADVEEFVSNLENIDVFIAHSNPMMVPNFDKTDAHRGFLSFTSFIQKVKPTFFIHGHNHENVSEMLGETKVICVFPYLLLEI